jgi:NAD-dependent SIR2 family protein deacetylase
MHIHNTSWNHFTGRICSTDGCKGRLQDTIVNFGDDLFENGILGGIARAVDMCKAADVILALGSSLTVC